MRRATNASAAATLGALAVSLWITACAGNGAGLDANGQPLGAGGGAGGGALTADFDSIQAQVLTPVCTVCHIGAGAPHGLRLDAADSYNLLVGVPSEEVPALLRVKSGDPEDSYIVQKLEGHAAVGARMPLGGPYLSSDVIDVIRQWITDGALRSQGSAAAVIHAIVVAPATDEILAEAPPQIMLGFEQDVDVTRIDSDSVRLERQKAVGAADTVEIVPARIMFPSGNARALLVWPLQRLPSGHYRLLLGSRTYLNPDDAADRSITTFDVETAP